MSLKGCVSVVELERGGSATIEATPSSLLVIIQTGDMTGNPLWYYREKLNITAKFFVLMLMSLL